jgi:hypothetical protein
MTSGPPIPHTPPKSASGCGCAFLTWVVIPTLMLGVCYIGWIVHPIVGIAAAIFLFGGGGAAVMR